MAAEAGECDGRCGELKAGEEEEVGGSYVIVNGSSGNNSEEDLDLDLHSDHSETKKEENDADIENVGGGKNGELVAEGSDVAIAQEKGAAQVEEMEERNDAGVGGTELGSQHPEPEIAAVETAAGGGSELPFKVVGDSEQVTDSIAEIEVVSRLQLGDPVVGDSVSDANAEVEENGGDGSGAKLEPEPEPDVVVVEMEGPRESEASVKVEDVKEPEPIIPADSVETVVEETGCVEVDSAAEDDNVKADERIDLGAVLEEAVPTEINIAKSTSPVEIESVGEEAGNMEPELGAVVKVESRPLPEIPVAENDKAESEEIKEPVSVAEESKIGALELGAEVESRVDVEEVKDPEHVIEETCNAGVEVEVESSEQPENLVVKDDKIEPEGEKPVLEEAMAEETYIVESESVAEVELKIEPGERNNLETVIEEADGLCGKSESVIEEPDGLHEKSEPELVASEADQVDEEETREPEASTEALGSVADVEPSGAVVTESTLSESECLPVGNDMSEIPNVEADAPTDKQSIQEETEAISVSDDVGVSTENVNVLNSGECSGSPKKFVEEATQFIDVKHLEFGVLNHSEIVTSVQLDEPISSGPVPLAAEQKATELCPTDACEMESGISVELVAADRGFADHVGEMHPESVNGSESIDGGNCKAGSTEENSSTNKDEGEGSSHDQIAADEVIEAPSETRVVKWHPVYLIKVPRFTDGELDRKIHQAVMDLNEKTQLRDSIQEDIRNQLVTLGQLEQELKDASSKENAERDVLNAKYEEIEGVQLLINRINNVTSIADIDEKIQNMSHRQQHETIDLKQEKLYIREINQLKKLREQLSNSTTQEQIDEALGQKSEVYARLEKLRKELKPLRESLNLSIKSRNEVWQRVLGERNILMALREQYQIANVIRQEAYRNMQELKKQSAEKFKHFSMYKADQNVAANFRFSGDNEGLQSHCNRQVERVMELWNGNEDFRKEYVKSNANSTLRRLGTLDGRPLGPGEEAPVVSSHMDKKPKSLSLPSSNLETSAPLVVSGGKPEKSEALATKQVTRANQSSKVKSSSKPVNKEVMPTISNCLDPQKQDEKEPKVEEVEKKEEDLATKEEELRKEKAAKEEELRKEKAAKEELRLEQKAKAKEAEERKKRMAEKARAKADRRIQKEAELKEKKKAKKETKKAYGEEARNGNAEGQSTPTTDMNLSETSVPHKAETTVASASKRRSSRSVVASKQYGRVQPLPLPLRNRGKRKMTTWMWAILATLSLLLLLFAGNYVSVSNFGTKGFKF